MTVQRRCTIDFFGTAVDVRCSSQDIEDIAFFFGPHVLADDSRGSSAAVVVELTTPGAFLRSLLAKDNQTKRFRVIRVDGTVLDDRTFTRWSHAPSPLPPFQALRSLVCVVRATVLSRGTACVALFGPPYSGKSTLAMYMLRRGWSWVSDQLLVVERHACAVRPYLVPVGMRGATLAMLPAAGDHVVHRRTTMSEVTGRVVLARPEHVGPTVDPRRTLPLTHAISVRRREAVTGIRQSTIAPTVWPPEATGWLYANVLERCQRYTLTLPPLGGEDGASRQLEESIAKDTNGS